MKDDTIQPGVDDFDFIMGSWTVAHRCLKERLAGCTEWIEFTGTSTTRKVLGGFGNLEDNTLSPPSGSYCAVALRSFDRRTGNWSIWWLNGRVPGEIDIPVVGKFTDGIGEFYADDQLNGKKIRIRLTWSVPEPGRPHWEQAFSEDGGQSWETNWLMEFTRCAPES
jgi:hypothetical protein